MPKNTITPGEWVVLTTFEPEINTTTYRIRPHAKTEMEAVNNAQAIAAVPDMIACLVGIIDQANAQYKQGDEYCTLGKSYINSIADLLRKAGQID